MKIELLYFDGCPSWQTAFENLKRALQVERISDPIQVIEIVNAEQASQEKFLGSPSVRIDGRDLWYEQRENYSLSCRVYTTPEGVKGSPTVEMLRFKIQSAVSA
ncbi:hypothetical protein ANAEL_02091 [Anaerolineales bacterium]|nr:hypothetical protein ANAEL_02091 [Anaerolineales bacterium]